MSALRGTITSSDLRRGNGLWPGSRVTPDEYFATILHHSLAWMPCGLAGGKRHSGNLSTLTHQRASTRRAESRLSSHRHRVSVDYGASEVMADADRHHGKHPAKRCNSIPGRIPKRCGFEIGHAGEARRLSPWGDSLERRQRSASKPDLPLPSILPPGLRTRFPVEGRGIPRISYESGSQPPVALTEGFA